MFKNSISDILTTALEQRPDLFLIDFTIKENNDITVVIDGDNGVTVEDCMFISRAVEHSIDRDEYDFSLDVMSAGATTPIVNNRQYKKNLQRTLKIKTVSENIEGILTNVNEIGITLEWKVKVPKQQGKGKITINKQVNIAYKDIIEARVMIKF